MGHQGELDNHNLFPIQIRALYPNPTQSRDMQHKGECVDGRMYAIKEKLRAECMIPASEFFCSCLAQLCSVPVLSFDIAELPDGSLAFAAPWVEGQKTVGEAIRHLKDQNGPCSSDLVNIFLFDLLVHNLDRHAGNYFFTGDNIGTRVRAFDHSRALFTHGWPLPKLPLPASCGTMQLSRVTPIFRNATNASCEAFLSQAQSIRSTHASAIMGKICDEWMPAPMKAAVVGTWDTFIDQRVAAIAAYLEQAKMK